MQTLREVMSNDLLHRTHAVQTLRKVMSLFSCEINLRHFEKGSSYQKCVHCFVLSYAKKFPFLTTVVL